MPKATNQVRFNHLKTGETFYHNGNTYIKKSNRTAHLQEYDRRFYFGQKEWVIVFDTIANRIFSETCNLPAMVNVRILRTW